MQRTNVVGPKVLRKVQMDTLETLYTTLKRSFGPNASNSQIYKGNMFPVFTKDGLKIVRETRITGEIESSIQQNIDTLCQNQAKVVGDATTSIVLLSYFLFKELDKYYSADEVYDRQDVMTKFQEVVEELVNIIHEHRQETNLTLIEDICRISTNGREDLVKLIMDQYKKFGEEVLIEIVSSCSNHTEVFEFDGMMLFEGIKSGCYVNTTDNRCIINNPEIYFFDDPIDNKEMLDIFEMIVQNNIIIPNAFHNAEVQGGAAAVQRLANQFPNKNVNRDYVPTVIITPMVSKDFSINLKRIEEVLESTPFEDKPPFALITNVTLVDKPAMDDLCTMTGGHKITKYLDPNNAKALKELNLFPTANNYRTFAGKAKALEMSFDSTKCVGPAKMYNADGSYSDIYNGKLKELEAKYAEMTKNGAPLTDTFNYKKRIDGLKGKMVQISYAGISAQDREMDVDLLDDAVLNARSAVRYGVGYGANFEAYRAILELKAKYTEMDEDTANIMDALEDAYHNIQLALYETCTRGDQEMAERIIKKGLEKGCPYNIRAKEYDGKVLSSNETDVCILNTISKLLMVMFTTNQFILSDVNFSNYPTEDSVK